MTALPRTCSTLAAAALIGLGTVLVLNGSAAGQGSPAAPPASDAAADSPRLPWHPEPPAPRRSSPREMLELFNVDQSRLEQLQDGRPLVADEQETLWRILYRMPHFGQDKLHEWACDELSWETVAADPQQYRTEVFRLRGRVRRLERVELPPEAAALLEFDHYYRAEFLLDEAPHPVLIYCRQVPRAWHDRNEIDQPAECLGLLLKTGSADDGLPLYFAADRIAWLPDQPNAELGVGRDLVLLGQLGMDVGLWDLARQTNGRRLLAEDHEAFYQLLTAIDRAPEADLFDRAAADFDLAALLNKPQSQQGRLVTFTGMARRVQKILIEERGVRERFGIDHYYQIDVLVPLGDREVRLVAQPGQSEGPVFRNHYPVHCCVLRLPPGLAERPDVDQEIRVAGVYFKLWSYTTEYVQSFGREQRQLSPLFVAATPQLVVRQRDSNPLWGWIGGGLFAAALAGIAVAAWLHHRSDRKFRDQLRRRQLEVTPPPE